MPKHPYAKFVTDFYKSLGILPIKTSVLRKLVHVIESQRFKRFGIKKLYKIIMPDGVNSVINLPYGLKMYFNHPATLIAGVGGTFIEREYFLNKSYLPNENGIVVDIGSYVGLPALVFSKMMNGKGSVITIEPNPKSYFWLEKNLKLNKAKNVHAYQIAFGKIKGKLDFYTLEKGNPGVSTTKLGHLEGRGVINKPFKVPVIKFDDFIRDHKLRNIDLVKIDVEGAEKDILDGTAKSLRNGIIKRIIVEVHETVNSTESIINYLKSLGFRIDNVFKFELKSLVYACHQSLV